MKMTINKIKELNPCSSGYINLLNQLSDNFNKNEEFEVSSLVGGKNTIGDITWLLGKTNNKKALVEFAIFSAELVLPIYEKMHENKTPRKTLELVKKWLNNDKSVTRKELLAAAADADAAYAAAADAAAAAYADAAYAYAADAADAAAAYADANIKKQINNKLIEIINTLE